MRSVEALHRTQYAPLDEDQHTLPWFDREINAVRCGGGDAYMAK